ncbi:MAG: cobalamin biosynthesis protein [Alphaproteobacteria bacterium]|nr:cobalamin biosynthesis protein [Alphaproteobacteria bacterium]
MALVIVSCLGMWLGAFKGRAIPLYWTVIDLVFGSIGQKMDRAGRPAGDLIFRGFFLTVLVMAISFLLARGVNALVIPGFYPLLFDIVMLSLVLASGSVWKVNMKLHRALATDQTVPGAFYAIAVSSRTDLTQGDEFAITRTGMALLARSFDKGVVSPILWYLIGGLPAAFIYAGLAGLAWRFGRDGFTGGFGRMALELEKLMGMVPNLLAGLLMAMAGLFTPTGRMSSGLAGFLMAKAKSPYFQGGSPVTAMAYALNVTLGGAGVDQEGRALRRDWTGPERATAQLTAGHLHRAVYITLLAHILFILSLLGAMIVSGHHLLDFIG